MAYLPHCKVILNGILGSNSATPSEIFTTGHQISDTNVEALPSQAQVDDIAAAWGSTWSSIGLYLCTQAQLLSVTVVAIDSDGSWRKNTDGSYMKRTKVLSTPAQGYQTGRGPDYPVSSVASFITARAGAHGRGRMYLPLPAELANAEGYAPTSNATDRASAVAGALDDVNTALATGTYQGVAVVASSAGFNSQITAVRVGNVHDTQRRRRGNLHEVYQAANLTA